MQPATSLITTVMQKGLEMISFLLPLPESVERREPRVQITSANGCEWVREQGRGVQVGVFLNVRQLLLLLTLALSLLLAAGSWEAAWRW